MPYGPVPIASTITTKPEMIIAFLVGDTATQTQVSLSYHIVLANPLYRCIRTSIRQGLCERKP